MSIKKCIMNYFDKATNAMIPFHPQTESGAITDWHESVIKSLASKVLPTVVSELTTDSVMGKLMKMLLNASGVKYSIDTNGYVCLGSFFGGLIIQWGYSSPMPNNSTLLTITYPVSFNRIPLTINLTGHGNRLGSLCWLSSSDSVKGFAIFSANASDGSVNSQVSWLVVGF